MPHRVVVLPETAVVVVGSTTQLRAVVLDEQGDTIRNAEVSWTSNWEGVSVQDGLVLGVLHPGGPTVSARAGNAIGEARVWTQPRASSVKIELHVRRVSPGAQFVVRRAVVYEDGSGGGLGPLSYDEKSVGTISSSHPTVFDWVRPTDNFSYNPGYHVEALAPGTAVLRFDYGGQSDEIQIEVESPALVFDDAAQSCALAPDGSAWCRGSNTAGELGTMTAPWTTCCGSVGGWWQQGSSAPVAVDTDVRFRSLVRGFGFHCGLSQSDEVLCWGSNDSGSLGVATSDSLVATPEGEPRCSWSSSFFNRTYYACHFRPVIVDRDLGQVLRFGEVRAEGTRACARAVRRGPNPDALVPVDEIWCWGGEYGTPPQQRPGFFQ